MRCPVCRAENGEDVACRRCRADLSLLVNLEIQRRRDLEGAARAATMGDGEQVLGHAGAAHALRQGDDTVRLLALGHLLQRDFAAAFSLYQSMSQTESPAAL